MQKWAVARFSAPQHAQPPGCMSTFWRFAAGWDDAAAVLDEEFARFEFQPRYQLERERGGTHFLKPEIPLDRAAAVRSHPQRHPPALELQLHFRVDEFHP